MSVERPFLSALSHYDPADLLDTLATGLIVLDAQLCVVYANVAAQNLLAMSLNQFRGRPFYSALAESDGLIATIKRARESGESFSERELTVRTVAAPREPRILDVVITALEGHLTGTQILLEIADATQRARISRESDLRARLDVSRMMVRQLAHEIKNPLGGLRGAAQLLDRALPDASLREYTSVIIGEADRLTALVDSMNGPTRAPQKVKVNVHEICEHIYLLLHGEAHPGVLLERDYDPSLPDALIDRNQIIQALLNLCRNAMQAVGERGRVTLRTRAVSNVYVENIKHRLMASVQVEDNGSGVPADIRSSIFFPLVTGRANGTGLGLAIAQDLVTRHGGMIEFESEPGRTIFTMLLPLDEPAHV